MHKIEGNFDLIIHDEHHRCLLGSTLIDGVKIKDIVVGSFQKSFNFVKGIYEYKKVLNVFKNPLTENLIKIKCNGKEIICTESHEIFTRRGWVKAKDILPEDELQVV
jgi:intein/homing endonuclease